MYGGEAPISSLFLRTASLLRNYAVVSKQEVKVTSLSACVKLVYNWCVYVSVTCR